LLSFPGQKTGIILRVREERPNLFSGLLGYVPARGRNKKGYITGVIDLKLGNLLGTGRSFAVNWNSRTAASHDLQVQYAEPWVLGFPVDGDFAYRQSIQDSTFLQRDFRLGLQYAINNTFSVKAVIGQETTMPEEYGEKIYQLKKFKTLYGSLGLSADSRDDKRNPRRGFFITSEFSLGNREINGNTSITNTALSPKSITDQRVMLEMQCIFPIRRKNLFFLKFHHEQINSSDGEVPFSQLIPLGGSKTLRGYREQQFRGSRTGYINFEFRHILSRKSRLFLFFDGGYYTLHKKTMSKLGYGWGLRADTRLGVLGLDFGLGEDGDFSNAKIHVVIENNF